MLRSKAGGGGGGGRSGDGYYEDPTLKRARLPKPPADPTISPGPGFEWRGRGEVGTDKGSWYNPETGETWHPDLWHRDPIPPHWDYTPPGGGPSIRIFL